MSEEPPGLAQPLRRARSCHVEAGDICRAHPDQGADLLVLVVAVHEDQVEALLCGHECEWATETDSVLAPAVTGYANRLLVHGDVSGRILKTRLDGTIGHVTPELAERIAVRGRGLDFASADLGRGRAIVDESDPRWDWKLDKFRQLRSIRARAPDVGWSVYKLGDPSPREA